MSGAILPGSTIGILGGGQLGRMSAIAARRLGYRIVIYSHEQDCPAGQVADRVFVGAWDDEDQLRSFAQVSDVVTLEFENVSASAAAVAARHRPLHPHIGVLETAQRRAAEKNFLRKLGIPVADFTVIPRGEDLTHTPQQLPSFPAILKSSLGGYDGKGQVPVSSPEGLKEAHQALGRVEAVLEQRIDLALELSVVGARDAKGNVSYFGPIQNVHRHHILDLSWMPAELPPGIADQALEVTRTILEQLDMNGVLCAEFFLDTAGRLLVNELAPRPHNSGHLTIDAHTTCQFEQHVRAICGLPPGKVRQWRPAAMANLLGELWAQGTPCWEAALAAADVKLHLYGKGRPVAGRKMGHLTALADTVDAARQAALAARSALLPGRQEG